MSTTIIIIFVILAFTVLPVLLSMVVESLRRPPEKPVKLYWDDSIPILYTDIDGVKIRYIKTGTGPDLVLLHTIRSQLDLFEKVIPDLSRNFTVYALDYPGHGFSDTPDVDYDPDMFSGNVEKWLDKLDINNAILSGISIGGVIPLLLASKHNPRIKGVVSFNPYDYNKGLGVRRGNMLAWIIVTSALVPVLGETVMRFRIKLVEKIIFQGGVTRNDALTRGFVDAFYHAGDQHGRYRALINLFRNGEKWELAHDAYKHIRIPVRVVHGEYDWSNEAERKRTISEIPQCTSAVIKNGGHFIAMDQPGAVIAEIRKFHDGLDKYKD